MSRRATYTIAMAVAGLLAAAVGLAFLGIRTDLYFTILPVAALSGAAAGWTIPAFLFRRFGETRKWALLSGLACAFAGLTVGAVAFSLAFTILDGDLFTRPGDALAMIFTVVVFAHVVCGIFGYPLAILAAYIVHASTRETREAAGDVPRRPPEQSES